MRKLLIIGYVWPEPKSSAAGSRMMQLIEAFQNDSYTITFASPCAKTDNAFDLNSIDVTTVEIELNNPSFDDFIKKLKPDVVMFDRFMMEEQFGWRVAEHCPKAIRILDTEDLHCLRKGRHKAFKDNQPFDDNYLFSDIAKREIASIYRCDLTLIISEAEIELLNKKFKVATELLQYTPFLLESLDESIVLPSFKERAHFITIGNFLHEPNYNSVLYLKHAIWPLIRKQLPKAEMHIYGAYASQKVTQLHNDKEGFLVKGFAEDVNEVMQQARVCLAPLQFGAGLKGKLIDAMVNGTPSGMSTIAAEGMFGDMEACGFIADDPDEFANNSVELYNDENLWSSKQQHGFEVINSRFNKITHSRKLLSRVEAITENLENHRLQNFMGSMLQHHTMQSTKFMSRWIEEKNKQV